MRWPWGRSACPSDDERRDLEHAQRSLRDAQALGRYAGEISRQAEELDRHATEVRDGWRETKQTNHVAEAVVETILRRVRHQ